MSSILFRRVITCLGFLFAAMAISALLPSVALAQCDEQCAEFVDENDEPVGHGCLVGSEGDGCVATVDDCDIDTEGCDGGGSAVLLDESGVGLRIVDSCAEPIEPTEHFAPFDVSNERMGAPRRSQVGEEPAGTQF